MNYDSNQDLCLPLFLRKIFPHTIDVLRLLDVCLIEYNDHSNQKKHKNLNAIANNTVPLSLSLTLWTKDIF